MIDLTLARKLRTAGLRWVPAEGDRFVLPDRDLDDRVFTISPMVVEVRRSAAGTLIAFNGTTEWSLDSVDKTEAIWLPREDQLREALGSALLSLVRADDRWRCTLRLGDQLHEHEAPSAAKAYARALLTTLQSR